MSATLQRILYVEDDVDIRTVSKLALEAVGGFEVEVAASGEEALVRVREFVPDLLLLDVMMPGMDGPTTLRALRTLPDTEAVPAIFMTARALPGEILALKAEGAVGVITKPFDPMTLADQLRALWETQDV